MPRLAPCWGKFEADRRPALQALGAPDAALQSKLDDRAGRLQFLLGGYMQVPSCAADEPELWAKDVWMMDKAINNWLLVCVLLR